MRRPTGVQFVAFALVWLACALAPLGVGAAEPVREFLEKLRAAGYYDTALEYLDQLPGNPTTPPDILPIIRYEKGVTLIAASKATRDAGIRERQLNEAQTNLQAFLDVLRKNNDTSHKLLAAAEKQLGNVLVERARMVLERAKRPGVDGAALRKEARDLYDAAYKVFDTTQRSINERLKSISPTLVPGKDDALIEVREQLRIDSMQTQLLAAAVKEESADTLDPASNEYKRTLQTAAKEYGDIHDRYRNRLAGMHARLYQGRCYQKTGDDKEALSHFVELLEEPETADEVRDVKTKALTLAMKSWLSSSLQRTGEAIDKGTKWLAKVRPGESKDRDWLELRLVLAKAYLAQSREAKDNNAALATQAQDEARQLAKFVASVPGEFQKEARQLLTELGVSVGTVTSTTPKNFNEALDAGRELLESMKSAQVAVQALPSRLSQEENPEERAALQKQLEEATQINREAPGQAIQMFKSALALAQNETPIADINLVQYYLCYLSYLNNNLAEAAMLGNFVAKRYPDSAGARACAKIAMIANVRLFDEAQKALKDAGTPEDQLASATQFEAARIVDICEYITQKWPGQTEADEAFNTLIPFMIQNRQLAQAEAYLQKIPADSPSRGSAELTTGQAMWKEYLRGMLQVRELESDPSVAESDVNARKQALAELKVRAEKTLADGVQRMKASSAPNPTFAAAMLSLASIYVDTNQAQKALAELEDPKVGPLTLVAKQDPLAARPGFAEDTLRVALRAYIGSLQTSGADVEATLAKANGILDQLKAVVGDDAAGQARLVRNYFTIARDLKSQIELADSPAAKSALSNGFEQFLMKVSSTASDIQVLNWVAETFYGMGEAFDAGQGRSDASPEAKKYYSQAQTVFENILTKVNKQQGSVNDEMLAHLRLRSASCKRKLGEHAAAIQELEAILKTMPTRVNVQIEAAMTYQDWGASSQDSKQYYRAIVGGENLLPGKREPIVWGWMLLSKKTANAKAFREAFLEARLNLARSRYAMGKLLTNDKAKRLEYLRNAKQDIRNIEIVARDYGGDGWRDRFDRLMREIQKDLGEPTIGLKEFAPETKPVATS